MLSFLCFITADCTVWNVLIVWICGNFPRAFILNRNYCITGKFILIVAKYYHGEFFFVFFLAFIKSRGKRR